MNSSDIDNSEVQQVTSTENIRPTSNDVQADLTKSKVYRPATHNVMTIGKLGKKTFVNYLI